MSQQWWRTHFARAFGVNSRINLPDARARGVDVTVTKWASVRASRIASRPMSSIGGGYH